MKEYEHYNFKYLFHLYSKDNLKESSDLNSVLSLDKRRFISQRL